MKTLTLTLAATLLTVTATRTQGTHPATLELDGGVTVPLAAQAKRADLAGSIEFYDVALYADVPLADRARLTSPETPKAVRIVITYAPDLRRPITLEWQRELVPALEAPAIAELRRIFAPLRRGDVVQIDYGRSRGTTLRIDRDTAVTRGSHDLVLAFFDHWIGQRPVSEEIKRALLGR